ncbi:mannose-6-phosphate isomerase [Portibacter lacus]|uniref:Mannose-6-phosphate isomerase n=2 Tax=Portibacter lacus TaxID=1099794 RepID=A0AA37WF05_9BACT|nr:mannose-6-phosphate isomerase [Portibacter lacus]
MINKKEKMKKVNLAEKLSMFNDHWNPRIIGELNGQHVKVAKLKGEFPWHKHDDEDELFYVVNGSLTIRFRADEKVLESGEFLIVPRGVEHQPYAEEEVSVMLFEPATTINTGNLIEDKHTKIKLDRI